MIKILLIALAFFVPVYVGAVTFMFTNGEPNLHDDGVVGDTFEQTKHLFFNGEPAQVLDTTATEAVAETGGTSYLVSIPTQNLVVIPTDYLMIIR